MTGQRARQAVVVVHGIGQQRPMSTLSGYVNGIVEEHDLAFAAPDRISGQADLKRMKVTWLPPIVATDDGSRLEPVTTDLYELYWANLVQGTERRHVIAWLGSLLPRWRSLGPRLWRFLRFHLGYAALTLMVATIILVLSFALGDLSDFARSAFRWISILVIPAASGWIVLHLGDVPRYLHNVADNVTIQRAIRQEGVELLRRLHRQTYTGSARPMYERIVVVGHSLGSVVAYDIIRDYWTETNRFYGVGRETPPELSQIADAVEDAGERLWEVGPPGPSTGDAGFTDFQSLQRRLSARWTELRSDPPGNEDPLRWAVTDLVTLACPLTHADFLLASGMDAIAKAQWNRTLACCPPRRQLDRPSYRFEYVRGRVGTQSWHQTALFAATRWTNVYYESDVVGGPLQTLFGPGINDIALVPDRGSRGRMPKVHSLYDDQEEALGILRRVIWDGGTRADRTSIESAQRDSLRRVIRELIEVPSDRMPTAVASLPLLSLLDAGHRQRVVELVRQLQASGDAEETVTATVNNVSPDLLERVRVGASSLSLVAGATGLTRDDLGADTTEREGDGALEKEPAFDELEEEPEELEDAWEQLLEEPVLEGEELDEEEEEPEELEEEEEEPEEEEE